MIPARVRLFQLNYKDTLFKRKFFYLGLEVVCVANLFARMASVGEFGVTGDVGDGGEQSLTAESELRRILLLVMYPPLLLDEAHFGGRGGGKGLL